MTTIPPDTDPDFEPRADRVWDAIRELQEQFYFLELQEYDSYAEDCGYDADERSVISGNWNYFSLYLRDDRTDRANEKALEVQTFLKERYPDLLVDEDGEPQPFYDTIEEFAHTEWCDEGTNCSVDGCYVFIQTSPDSYSWQPQYLGTVAGPVCKSCVREDPEMYLEEYIGGHAVKPKWFDIEPLGFVRVDHRLDHGMYRSNANHDPREIRNYLIEIDRGLINDHDLDFIFEVAERQQFQSYFYLYVRIQKDGDVNAEATQRLAESLPPRLDDFSEPGVVAEVISRALATIDMTPGPPGTVKYHSISDDGSVESRVIPGDEFVEHGVKGPK